MLLSKILDLKKWQSLQDSLAKVTKMAIITVDYKGIPVTQHSDPRPLCKLIRKNPNMVKYCQKCDSRAGIEAVRVNAPYIYLCHCNIVDVAAPISINDQYIGAVMAGQVRLADDENHSLEQILISPLTKSFDLPEMQQMYEELPILSYQEIEIAAQLLFDFCNYIVEEAINKNLILEMYEKMSSPRSEISSTTIAGHLSTNSLENLKKELDSIVVSAHIKTYSKDQFLCKNSALKPAFNYIYANKGKNVSQKQMAALCSFSTSHFSRLFVKETGQSFSVFLNHQKLEFSKQLLEKTDLHVAQISDELGYSSPGHYIKTFKKYEGITPSNYRKYVYKNLKSDTEFKAN